MDGKFIEMGLHCVGEYLKSEGYVKLNSVYPLSYKARYFPCLEMVIWDSSVRNFFKIPNTSTAVVTPPQKRHFQRIWEKLVQKIIIFRRDAYFCQRNSKKQNSQRRNVVVNPTKGRE